MAIISNRKVTFVLHPTQRYLDRTDGPFRYTDSATNHVGEVRCIRTDCSQMVLCKPEIIVLFVYLKSGFAI